MNYTKKCTGRWILEDGAVVTAWRSTPGYRLGADHKLMFRAPIEGEEPCWCIANEGASPKSSAKPIPRAAELGPQDVGEAMDAAMAFIAPAISLSKIGWAVVSAALPPAHPSAST